MYFRILSIFIPIICLVIHKKKFVTINKIKVARQILWLETCFFFIVYVITDNHWYRVIWLIFLLLASLSLIFKEK